MAQGEMLPITNDTAKRGTRAARIKREAEKEVEEGAEPVALDAAKASLDMKYYG